jgi:molecular chaperone DnaJ
MTQKGSPKFRGQGNGDQYVKINIKIPTKLTREQKEIWSKLNEIKDEKPGFFEGVF